ncbi:MAG: ABC transporter substrate-binding protein [Bacteroidetes bacterium]|nr:MAG: ABC transporter substrate-binding protein [Bacteroidota bacterium]
MHKLIFFLIVIVFFSCSNHSDNYDNTKNLTSDTVSTSVKYAKGFSITYHNNFRILKVFNPWQGACNVQYQYVLADNPKKVLKKYSKIQIIKTPVKKVVCLSTTHIAFIDFIDETNSIIGVSNIKFINNKNVNKLYQKNKIVEVGYDQNLNYELIISLKPDLIITYGVDNKSVSYINKLKEFGIPVIINAEYLEHEPLAKAEWVKFIAAFYNKSDLANKKFDIVVNEYNKLKHITDTITQKPSVITGLPWKDTWYVPGGKSFAAQFLYDAGANYLFSDDASRESLALDIETVFAKAQKADYWINIGTANKIDDIINVDIRLKNFYALSNKNVYNNNAVFNKYGGNDYWESGIVNPQIILKDLIHIFHPDIFSDYNLYYYKKIY